MNQTLSESEVEAESEDEQHSQSQDMVERFIGGNTTEPSNVCQLQDNVSMIGAYDSTNQSGSEPKPLSPLSQKHFQNLSSEIFDCLSTKKRLLKEFEKTNERLDKLLKVLKEESGNLNNNYLDKAMK